MCDCTCFKYIVPSYCSLYIHIIIPFSFVVTQPSVLWGVAIWTIYVPTVCLGSTNTLSLCSKLKQVNLLEMTQKLISVTEMTFLYATRYLIVLLRQKIEVKLSTQSAPSHICMGKWPVPGLANFFCHVVVVRFLPDLLTLTRTLR